MNALQVKDDLELLSMMMDDMNKGAALYKPTNYWSVCEKKLLPELKELGLRDFRRRRDSILTSMGATDLIPTMGEVSLRSFGRLNNRYTRKLPFWLYFLGKTSKFLNYMLRIRRQSSHYTLPYSIELENLGLLAYEIAKNAGEFVCNAKPISQFEVSLVGNPEDVFDVDGRKYTLAILNYYLHYVYASHTVDFEKLNSVVELGCGLGRQAEIIGKLHPNISYLLFDIPPQLYVCQQYLNSVFPGRVISYRQTREMTALPSNLEPGKIYICGTNMFPLLKGLQFDLFWNAASFQEMEPNVVANYLKYVNSGAIHIYLHQKKGSAIAKSPGEVGVLEQTTFTHYRENLPDFKLVDLSPSLGVLRRTPYGYYNSMWLRNV